MTDPIIQSMIDNTRDNIIMEMKIVQAQQSDVDWHNVPGANFAKTNDLVLAVIDDEVPAIIIGTVKEVRQHVKLISPIMTRGPVSNHKNRDGEIWVNYHEIKEVL